MEKEESKFASAPLNKGDLILSQGGKDYVQIAAGEPYEAHIAKIEVVQSPVYDNPTETEEKLAIGFQLDADVDGKGQIYTNWYRPSLNPKAKLTPLVLSLYNGKVPDTLDPTDMLGRPLRIVLTEGVEKNGKTRQYVASYLKPTSAQKIVDVEAPKVVEDTLLTEADLDALFN